MDAKTILSTIANKVSDEIAVAFFNTYAERYNLTKDQDKEAFSNFESLRKMNIPFSLALITSVSLAQM